MSQDIILNVGKKQSALFWKNQIDDKRQNLVINIILSLVHDIQLVKHEKEVTFVLFMDIKGAFDHVLTNQMLKICQEL